MKKNKKRTANLFLHSYEEGDLLLCRAGLVSPEVSDFFALDRMSTSKLRFREKAAK